MKIRTIFIHWDTDGEDDVDLPQVVTLEVEDEGEVADTLSDKYGWCVTWCDYEILS